MASGSEIDDENKVVYSEITAINDLFSAVVTLTSPPLPTLPEDVIPEILCRLSVKLLLQLRCVCKSWNALISDSKFVKKHLRMSTTRRLHFLSYPGRPQNKYILTSYPLDSILTNPKANFTQFEYSPNNFNGVYPRACFQQFIGSCNGILCFADDYKGLVILWNPSIRRFKELPIFTKAQNHLQMTFGFGYDSSKDIYKVVVVLDYYMPHTTNEGSWVENIEVKVHTLGTNIWRNIQGYPFAGVPVWGPGKFVSGTINWLVSGSPRFIVSFDLANESYQKILLPIGGEDMCDLWSLGVLRDCLCVTSGGNDVWIMEEYGNNKSWTKLFTFPYIRDPNHSHVAFKPIYIFENGQVILKFMWCFNFYVALYDSKNGTLVSTYFTNTPEVCVESLISPCSLC